MLFRIRGVDDRGRKREIAIDARSEEEARRRVAEMGVTISGAEGFPEQAPVSPSEVYPAIRTYARILRILGCVTIVFAVVAAFTVSAIPGGSLVVGGGIGVAGLVGGAGQFAFAEVLSLLVRLQANTQY